MLVTVASFREPWEAHLLRGRLQAEGLFAVVSHEYWIGNDWPMSVAFGGVKVQVVGEEYEAARRIERACCRGEFRDVLRAEIGDLDDSVCPNCGGTEFRIRRPFPRAALAIAVSLTLGTVVPPLGWILRCVQCQREFRAPRLHFSGRIGAVAATGLALMMIGVVTLWLWNSLDFQCVLGIACN